MSPACARSSAAHPALLTSSTFPPLALAVLSAAVATGKLRGKIPVGQESLPVGVRLRGGRGQQQRLRIRRAHAAAAAAARAATTGSKAGNRRLHQRRYART